MLHKQQKIIFTKSNAQEWSAYEYIVFTPAQFCAAGVSSGPSDRGDHELGGLGEIGRVYCVGVDLLLISFLYCSL
jgi:hypothetical protein